jgi:hypothetical protein
MNIKVFDLEFGEDIKCTFLFKSKDADIRNVFRTLELKESAPLVKKILEHMHDIIQESDYAFAVRSYRGCNNLIIIEEGSQKSSMSFVKYLDSADELMECLINDDETETTLEEIIKMYRALPDLPKLHIYQFDESLIDWEVDRKLIIGGELHTLKFQTKELHETWKKVKALNPPYSIMFDFVYKIYKNEDGSFVWYFVSGEEKARHTRNEV